ncbi:DUF6252 family protein [Foetidibacter luteolus]|uniref:DUF6252 family protein n=1 Tax=Foetidibacter luteolus TaxID=2608880 RepID=UPI00129B06AA|nr:DUF6252 family protein [Foetidibacter luteolus]
MKPFSLLALLFFVLSAFLSCQKEITDWEDVPSGDFTATIAGEPWSAGTVLKSASRLAGVINITGRSNDNRWLTITLKDSGVHRYALVNNVMNAALFYDSMAVPVKQYVTMDDEDTDEVGGEVNITEIDTVKKTISGTFAFVMYTQYDSSYMIVENGVFKNISYATTVAPSPHTSNAFKAKIDGVEWTPYSITGIISQDKLIINATMPDVSRTMGFQLPADIQAGKHSLGIATGYTAVYLSSTTNYLVDSGELNILEHDKAKKKIKGEFNFKASDIVGTKKVDITEGAFSISY